MEKGEIVFWLLLGLPLLVVVWGGTIVMAVCLLRLARDAWRGR